MAINQMVLDSGGRLGGCPSHVIPLRLCYSECRTVFVLSGETQPQPLQSALKLSGLSPGWGATLDWMILGEIMQLSVHWQIGKEIILLSNNERCRRRRAPLHPCLSAGCDKLDAYVQGNCRRTERDSLEGCDESYYYYLRRRWNMMKKKKKNEYLEQKPRKKCLSWMVKVVLGKESQATQGEWRR